jgi:hypothetical protein
LEIQTSNILKKTIAVLLIVLFVVSLTAAATSAKPEKAITKKPEKEITKNGNVGSLNHHPVLHCSGKKPSCMGNVICAGGEWRCLLPIRHPCSGKRPFCGGQHVHSVCVNGQWRCQ